MLNQVSWIKRPQGQDAQADRSLTEKVSAIIERVKTEGDTALRAFSQQFDNVVPTHFEVSEQEIAEALQGMDAQTRRDSEFAINQVRWRAGHCGHGLGNGEHSIGGQNRWARQRLR